MTKEEKAKVHEQFHKLSRTLLTYQAAINDIDDYFEYRYKSKKDKKYVYKVLNKLSKELSEIENGRV